MSQQPVTIHMGKVLPTSIVYSVKSICHNIIKGQLLLSDQWRAESSGCPGPKSILRSPSLLNARCWRAKKVTKSIVMPPPIRLSQFLCPPLRDARGDRPTRPPSALYCMWLFERSAKKKVSLFYSTVSQVTQNYREEWGKTDSFPRKRGCNFVRPFIFSVPSRN